MSAKREPELRAREHYHNRRTLSNLSLLSISGTRRMTHTSALLESVVVNAGYFSTTARRVTSPTWGPPPPCKQALSKAAYFSNRKNGADVRRRKTSLTRLYQISK